MKVQPGYQWNQKKLLTVSQGKPVVSQVLHRSYGQGCSKMTESVPDNLGRGKILGYK